MSKILTGELGKASPYFALLHTIRARMAQIEYGWEYEVKNPSLRQGWKHLAKKDMDTLKQQEYLLVNSSPKNRELIKSVRKQLNSFGTSGEHMRRLFGIAKQDIKTRPTDPRMAKPMKRMKQKGAKARQQELVFRLSQEMKLRERQGWYLIFNTLTVSAENYEKVFSKESTEWRDYIRTFDRAVGKTIYGTLGKAEKEKSKNPFHTYFAVVEKGEERGRLHIHVIHMIRELPRTWNQDPNRGPGENIYRVITPVFALWHNGHSAPIAVRHHDQDAFGKLGWQWPTGYDEATGSYEPIIGKPAQALAFYMTKYLTKSALEEKGKYAWRTRISRNLGLTQTRQLVKNLKEKQLEELLGNQTTTIMIDGNLIPNKILRQEALAQKISRENMKPKSVFIENSKTLKPAPNIVQRLRKIFPTRSHLIKSDYQKTTSSTRELSENMEDFKISNTQEIQKVAMELYPASRSATETIKGNPNHG